MNKDIVKVLIDEVFEDMEVIADVLERGEEASLSGRYKKEEIIMTIRRGQCLREWSLS